MKQYNYKDRQEYKDVQIKRSQDKFTFCKVYFADLVRYARLLSADKSQQEESGELGPILCLGVRSGAEVDMFRAVFYGPLMRLNWLQDWVSGRDQSKQASDKTKLAKRIGVGSGNRSDGRVTGVEINPEAQRPDIHIGSFDDLPDDWTDRFGLLYTNSFDHAMNPERTIDEWRRVAVPGAYLIIAFTAQDSPTISDPLGGLSTDHLIQLLNGEVVFKTETPNRGGYQEICLRLS